MMGVIHRKGLTLVELIVTLALIGLLAAMVVPVAGRVRDGTRSAACLSNLRQLTHGFGFYAADHQGRTPPDEVAMMWDTLFHPYLPNHRVFICPADREGAAFVDAVSYAWRDGLQTPSPDAALSGRNLYAVSRGDLLLTFDGGADPHQTDHLNGAAITGSAADYTVEAFETNLGWSVW
ncbi:MAG: type II secretion system protein [Phycisphaeraceae bacterium]